MPSILVVEDHGPIRDLMRFLLEAEGFAVLTAEDGAEALRRAADSAPDLIVMDVMIREVNGFECCSRLKADPRTCAVPVILVSARGQKNEILEGLSAGAAAYIVKPFEPEQLIEAVRRFLPLS